MPRQDSASSAERPSLARRNSSTHSLPRGSPSGASPSQKSSQHKPHRAHTTGHGRLPHARNPSYGKNLNKLTKLTGGDGHLVRTHTKAKVHTPSASPTLQQTKPNSSNVSLSRTGPKVSVKRNSSNISLGKRNGSTVQLGKATRPETPLRRLQPQPGHIDYKGPQAVNVGFSVGSEGQDEGWTEDSNSQSPSTTRQSSAGQSRRASPPDEEAHSHSQADLPDSPPESPTSTSSSNSQPGPARQNSKPYSSQYPSRPLQRNADTFRHPDPDVVTSRLLSRHSTQNLVPKISSVSATGTPGTHTPPIGHSQGSTLRSGPSIPSNGISRFLAPAGSTPSGSSTPFSVTQLHNALTSHPPLSNIDRTRSPAPELDHVRRSKSAQNLSSSPPGIISTSPPSYIVLPQPKRPGGNTQAKLDLWRSRTHVEPSQTSVAPHSQGLSSGGVPTAIMGLGMAEKRTRLSEVAEGEIGHLRRFRNPVLEGVGRILKQANKNARAAHSERGGGRGAGSVVQSRPGSKDGRKSRPGSRDGRRSRASSKDGRRTRGSSNDNFKGKVSGPANSGEVRGRGYSLDADAEDERESVDEVQELLRRMWGGPGMESGE